jgi:hypothetical protein
LKDKTHQARVAALSIAQCTTVVKLLRAHGQDVHAENVESALSAVMTIVSEALGRDTLDRAMNWVSDQTEGGSELAESVTALH